MPRAFDVESLICDDKSEMKNTKPLEGSYGCHGNHMTSSCTSQLMNQARNVT